MANNNDGVLAIYMAERSTVDSNPNLLWRRLATYYPSPRGDSDGVFYAEKQTTGSDKYSIQANDIGDVRVFKELGKNGNGVIELQQVKQPRLMEVIPIRDLSNLSIEDDADEIRRILNKDGFLIFGPIARCIERGNIWPIIKLAAPNDRTVGLMFGNPSKLTFSESNVKSFRHAVLDDRDLMNPTQFTASLSVVDLTDVNYITYRYGGGQDEAASRTFLAQEPTVIDQFMPHSTSEFFPVFLKRCLEANKDSIVLSNGAKLTNKDVTTIFNLLSDAAGDPKSIKELLKVTNSHVSAELSIGMQEMAEELHERVASDAPYANEIRKLLWDDEVIKKSSIDAARAEWMKSADAERESLTKDLAEALEKHTAAIKKQEELESEHANIKKQIAALQTEKDGVDAEIKRLDAELGQKQLDMASKRESFQTEAIALRNEVAKLALLSGVSAMNSIAYEGKLVATKNEMNALAANLALATDKDVAEKLSHETFEAIENHAHLAISGDYAETFAHLLSIALYGTTAKTVSCAGNFEQASQAEILHEINNGPCKVILIEGVYQHYSDNMVLSIARHVKDKLLVFSAEFPEHSQEDSPILASQLYTIKTESLVGKKFVSFDEIEDTAEEGKTIFSRDEMPFEFKHYSSANHYGQKSEN